MQPARTLHDRLHAVVDIVNLTAALHLAQNRLLNQPRVIFQHKALHRISVLRRLFQHAHIADAGKCHIQRARDRRCREREHIDAVKHRFEALLSRDAEALFLVNDRQTERRKAHILRNDTVCADQQIDLAAGNVLKNLRLLLFGAEARKQLNIHRNRIKAAQRRLIMLIRQHGRRREQHALLTGQNAFERGTERDLRLAEAHVAAEQSVHRARRFHIVLDLFNAPELIVRFHIGEAAFKIVLRIVIRQERNALRLLPRRVELDELRCHILDSLLDVGTRLVPFLRAELVQLDVFVILAADIARYHIELCGGDKERIRAGIFQLDIILRDALHIDLFNAEEPPDAVFGVNDQIALGDLRKRTDLLSLFILALFEDGALCLALRNADKARLGIRKSRGDTALHHQHPAAFRFGIRLCQHCGDVLIQQILHENAARLLRAGTDRYGVILPQIFPQIVQQQRERTAPRRKLRRLCRERLRKGKRAGACEKQVHANELSAAPEPFQHCRKIQVILRKLPADAPLFEHGADILRIRILHAADGVQQILRLTEHHRTVTVVEHGRRRIIDQREIEVEVTGQHAAVQQLGIVFELLFEFRRLLAAHGFFQFPQPSRELCGVGQRLLCGRDLHFFGGIGPALALGLKPGDRVDLVAPVFQTHRQRFLCGENIHNITAHRKLTGRFDLFHAQEAEPHQPFGKLRGRKFHAPAETDHLRQQRGLRNGILHDRLRGGTQHAAFSGGKRGQRGNAHLLVFARCARFGKEVQFLCGVGICRPLPCHKIDILAELLCGCIVRGDGEQRGILREREHHLCLVNLRNTGQGDRRDPLCKAFPQLGYCRELRTGIIKQLHNWNTATFL